MKDLKRIRKEAGLSQLDLASAVEVSLTTIRTWEKGASTPNKENMKKLKNVLASHLGYHINIAEEPEETGEEIFEDVEETSEQMYENLNQKAEEAEEEAEEEEDDFDYSPADDVL